MSPQLLRVSLEVKNNPGVICLLGGSTAILTCNLVGYPRPSVEFLHNSTLIVPAGQSRVSNISFDQVKLLYYFTHCKFCVMQTKQSLYKHVNVACSLL